MKSKALADLENQQLNIGENSKILKIDEILLVIPQCLV